MNINPTAGIGFKSSTVASTAAKRVTKIFVPAKEGTLRCEIGGNLEQKITVIKYDVLKEGKVIETKAYQDKNGIPEEKFKEIYENIQQRIKDGFVFLDELIKAQSKKNRV